MESGYFALSLLVIILNASYWIPAATSAATFTVEIESIIRNELLAACDLDGRRFPRQSIRSLKHGNFTVNLRHDQDYRTLTCNLLAGDKHGRFALFDSLEWNVSAFCAPDFVCRWMVVSGGLCLGDDVSNCNVAYYWQS
nr:hypothetical protein Iba_chr13fCG1200 [Ipomoea batatas]